MQSVHPTPMNGPNGQPVAYNTAPGYTMPPGPGYTMPPGPGYAMPPGPGYAMQPGPGYAMQPGPGYAMPPGPGYGMPTGPVIIQQVVQWPTKKTGYQTLAGEAGLFVKQKVEWLEVMTGCETENKYMVYGLGKNSQKGAELFKCKEKSDWCARNCLSGACRPFMMNIETITRTPTHDEHSPFLLLERECQCTFYCINRPEVRVSLVEDGKNEYIGKIVDPFTCCNMQLNIVDNAENIRYKAEGSCCQLGIWCKAPFEPCQTIDFDVHNPSGEKVGFLQKQSKGCLQAAVSDADNFELSFPPTATEQEKALLLAAVLFLDFRHFEEKGGNNNNNNGNGFF